MEFMKANESISARQGDDELFNVPQHLMIWEGHVVDDDGLVDDFIATTIAPTIPLNRTNSSSASLHLTLAVVYLGRYYIPTVVALGLIGNLISLIVFVSTYLNRLSLSVYLAALAVSDSGFLLALSIGWLEYAGLPLFHTNGWCQLVVYMSYVCSFLSAWFVVSFTVERYIAICHALLRPEMCTVRRARIVVLTLSAVGLAVYACSLWTAGIKAVGRRYEICTPLNDYYKIHVGLTYADAFITWVIPFACIVGFNIKIFHKISYFYNKRDAGNIEISLAGRQPHRAAPGNGSSRDCLGNRAQLKVTKLLLIVSSVFLIINLPSYAMRLRHFVSTFVDKNYKTTHQDELVQQLFQFLYYLNYSINFLLYSLCSKKFREALLRLGWQMKYKVSNFVRQGYRLLRGGSSSPESVVHDMHLVVRPAPHQLHQPDKFHGMDMKPNRRD